MSKIFIPATKPEDWKPFLAKPDEHWKTGHSAKALAYCWQEANGFPESVINVFKKSGKELFQNVEMLLGFPEYKVPLPGGKASSQNDIFIIAKGGNNQLISITVEGKVSESFGETVSEWKKDASEGRNTRLKYLFSKLELEENEQINNVPYQLLHRTVSAIIEAEKFNAQNALMLVHSFSQTDEGFDGYSNFLSLFGVKAEPDSLVFAKSIKANNSTVSHIDLYFGWVKGNPEYLKIETGD